MNVKCQLEMYLHIHHNRIEQSMWLFSSWCQHFLTKSKIIFWFWSRSC